MLCKYGLCKFGSRVKCENVNLGQHPFPDPVSTWSLVQSKMMDKETLQKSLTSKAWGKIIRRSSLRGWKTFEEKEEKVKVLLKILHFAELEEPIPLLVPLLDLICESCPGFAVEMTCPCRPEPHLISTDGFLLLEEVERSFSTTEQSLKKCSFGWYSDWFHDMLLSAVSSRMTRQKKEPLTNVSASYVSAKDKRSVEPGR